VNDEMAVAFGATAEDGTKCLTVGLLNLKTHSLAWTKQLPAGNGSEPTGQALVMVGDYVYVGTKSQIVRFTDADGTTKSISEELTLGDAPCYVEDMAAAADTVYVLASCLGMGDERTVVLTVDAGVGSLGAHSIIGPSDVRLPAGVGFIGGATFVSISPLVLLLNGDKDSSTAYSAFVRLDNSLKVSWSDVQQRLLPDSIDASSDTVTIDDAHHSYNRAFVANDTLFAVTTFAGQQGSLSNKVVAIDVDSGKQKWATTVPGASMVDPIDVQDSTLLAAGQEIPKSGSNKPATVLAELDVASGKVRSVRKEALPIAGAASGLTLADEGAMGGVAWVADDNRVYGASTAKAVDDGQPVVFSVG
jgi:outer membrane protein assembly factor BamB